MEKQAAVSFANNKLFMEVNTRKIQIDIFINPVRALVSVMRTQISNMMNNVMKGKTEINKGVKRV